MKRAFTMLVLLFGLLISCERDDDTNRNKVEYFEAHLKKDMNHKAVMTIFGQPSKDVGSGIHIYVYVLEDSTEVWIGITDVILYANHLDQDQQLIKELI